jgi:hypothetical protein
MVEDGATGPERQGTDFNRQRQEYLESEVEKKLQCVSTDSDAGDFILRGCNVHVEEWCWKYAPIVLTQKNDLVIGYNSKRTVVVVFWWVQGARSGSLLSWDEIMPYTGSGDWL